jgi:hypothetical protein
VYVTVAPGATLLALGAMSSVKLGVGGLESPVTATVVLDVAVTVLLSGAVALSVEDTTTDVAA